MNERGIALRRLVLTVVVSAVVAGCAAGMGGGLGSGGGSAATAPSCVPKPEFPDCQLWCWNGGPPNNNQNELLGHTIIVDQNPYCQHPSSSTPNICDSDPNSWPKQLTKPIAWKILTEFDFTSTNWSIPGGQVNILRRMRVPYLIGHSVARHHGPPTRPRPHQQGDPPLSLGRENLLIGYARSSEPLATVQMWGDVGSCPANAQGDSLALLAEFITINMMASNDTNPQTVSGWNTAGANGIVALGSNTWSFRGSSITVDYSFSFPVVTKDVNGTLQPGRIYVGYEGGGAY